MKFLINENQLYDLNEGNFNPETQRWNKERMALKKYLMNYGQSMISKENGKEYKVIFDSFISNSIGINYCVCIQYDSMLNDIGDIIYVRALDKFRPI